MGFRRSVGHSSLPLPRKRASGRNSLRPGLTEEGYRLESVVAGPAVPEIGHAGRAIFFPIRRGDRLATLGARILVRQIPGIRSGHRRLPCRFLLFLKTNGTGRLPNPDTRPVPSTIIGDNESFLGSRLRASERKLF